MFSCRLSRPHFSLRYILRKVPCHTFSVCEKSFATVEMCIRDSPKDVDNAARIDGANEYQIFFLIVFPLCFNVFLYMAIGMVMGLWMDFQGPLLYLGNAEDQYTVGLAFYYFYTSNSNVTANLQNKLMAMCVVMSLVPMALFLIFQKQMIGGIKIGGIKG